VLETAQSLFLRDGYNATTMEGVAAAAGISKATLYKYFPDKDELFFALVSDGYLAPDERLLYQLHETLTETLAQLRRRGSQAEVKRAIAQLLRAGAERRNDAFYRMLIELAFAQPPLLRRVRQELMQSKSEAFQSWTGRAIADLPPEIDGRALLHLFFVVINGYTIVEEAVFGQERIDPERLAETFAALICSAIE
jgi:AcrR family transcriptional regulator